MSTLKISSRLTILKIHYIYISSCIYQQAKVAVTRAELCSINYAKNHKKILNNI